MLTPTSEPDGHFRPLREARGTRRAKPRRRGCTFKVRANEPFYPAHVFPLRWAEEATGLARGTIER